MIRVIEKKKSLKNSHNHIFFIYFFFHPVEFIVCFHLDPDKSRFSYLVDFFFRYKRKTIV